MQKEMHPLKRKTNSAIFTLVMRITRWTGLVLPLLTLILVIAACKKASENNSAKTPVPPSSAFFELEYPVKGPGSKDRVAMGYFGTEPVPVEIFLFMISEKGDTFFRKSWDRKIFIGKELAQGPNPDSTLVACINKKLDEAIHAPEKDFMSTYFMEKIFLFPNPAPEHGNETWFAWSRNSNEIEELSAESPGKGAPQEILETLLKKKKMLP
jgi:hypothetical protein